MSEPLVPVIETMINPVMLIDACGGLLACSQGMQAWWREHVGSNDTQTFNAATLPDWEQWSELRAWLQDVMPSLTPGLPPACRGLDVGTAPACEIWTLTAQALPGQGEQLYLIEWQGKPGSKSNHSDKDCAPDEKIGDQIGSRLCHDLQNYLQVILGYTEMVGEEVEEQEQQLSQELSETLNESVMNIANACDRASELLTELTQFRHAKRSVPARFKLAEIAEQALRFIGNAGGQTQQWSLEIPSEIEVHGYPELLTQSILIGLWELEKHASAPGMLQVSNHKNGNGEGVLLEMIAPGARAGCAVTSAPSWTQLVHSAGKAGAQCCIEPHDTNGLKVSWLFNSTVAQTSSSDPSSVVLIESDSGVQKLLERVLTQTGFNALVYPNISVLEETQTIETLAGTGLVIMDAAAMNGTGLLLIGTLRKANPGLKCLLTMQPNAVVAQASQDFFYLPKPFPPGMLIAKLEEILGSLPCG